jgi:hypothetical protein
MTFPGPEITRCWQAGPRRDQVNNSSQTPEIEPTTLLDPLDVPARLEELKALRNGWLDGRGIAPDPAGLDWLAREIKTRYPGELPLPYIYPVAEGGVRLEWSITSHEVSLEIDLGGKSGEWHALDLDRDVDESRSLNLDDPASWDWMIRRLSEMVGASSRD